MSILPLVVDYNAVLHTSAQDVDLSEIKNSKFQQLIEDMIDSMIKYHGVGLAAPQIGRSIRLIITAKDRETADIRKNATALINPVITFISKEKVNLEEGCLSVPKKWGVIERAKKVRVKALDRNGNVVQIKAKDLQAQILQHEIDHLNGHLYIEKAKMF